MTARRALPWAVLAALAIGALWDPPGEDPPRLTAGSEHAASPASPVRPAPHAATSAAPEPGEPAEESEWIPEETRILSDDPENPDRLMDLKVGLTAAGAESRWWTMSRDTKGRVVVHAGGTRPPAGPSARRPLENLRDAPASPLARVRGTGVPRTAGVGIGARADARPRDASLQAPAVPRAIRGASPGAARPADPRSAYQPPRSGAPPGSRRARVPAGAPASGPPPRSFALPSRARAAPARRALPKARPILIGRALGRGAIRPPASAALVPNLPALLPPLPATQPDGSPLVLKWARPARVETRAPPTAAFGTGCRKHGHWHRAAGAARWHHGDAVGLWEGGEWSWLLRRDKAWWAWTGPASPAFVRHAGRWWWPSGGMWFLLHDGQAWGYRHFSDLGLEGFIHPSSETRMLYSRDGRKVAVVSPGQGAALFDAETGQLLGRWGPEDMPPPKRPRAPESLSLP